MKRIVLCFDGTWNEPADDGLPADQQVETNVRRFYESVEPQGRDGVPQIAWYDAGVGTERLNRLTGGSFGTLLDRHIIDGYRYLVDHFNAGDDIYILGFSRGAYAARSLVGMLRNCGLVDSSHGTAKIFMAYGIYRTREDGPDSQAAKMFRAFFSRNIKIKFLGVWDTVGALGIPLRFAADLNSALYQFHDTELSAIVEQAYQALALDEHRHEYEACLWNPSAVVGQTLEQRWFVGAHADVGGGYPSRKLSDLALNWIQTKASAAGLTVDKTKLAKDGFLESPTDSYANFLKGEYQRIRARFFRPVFSTTFGNEGLDETVSLRCNAATLDPRYLPKNPGFHLDPIP